MKLTINQIAELAQVSKGTVSKVINGHKGISAATRERILKLIKQLDYHPDASARALALQKTGVIGLLIPHEASLSLTGHYWAVVLSGISQELAAQGQNLMVLTTPKEGDIRGALNQLLKRSTVDGLIIGSELLDKESLSTLVLHKIPFVLLGRNPEFQHYCIDIDSHHGTRSLVDHMIGQGFRKIGGLFGPGSYPYTRERAAGYRQTLQDHNLAWSAEAYCEYRPDSVRQAVTELLDRHPDLDALYLASGGDFLLETLKVLRERGRTLPQFGVGVFDDYPFFDVLNPRVTAVRQPLFRSGQEAVRLLRRLVQDDPPDQFLVQLPTELIVRESCGELIRAK